MPPREPCDVVEFQSTPVPGLTREEAGALEELGRELRSTELGVAAEDDSESDSEGSGDDRASVISVTQRPSDQCWRVQVRNAIGVIGVDDLQINVLPKIGQSHFNHVAAKAVDPPRLRFGRQAFRLEPDSWFLPAVWGAFLDATELTLRADLHHEYEEHVDDPAYIRGRLDVRRVSLNLTRGILRFPAMFDELTVDNPVNRVLRAAAEAVEVAAEVAAPKEAGAPRESYMRLVSRAREAVYRMGDVGKMRPTDLEAELPRLASHQRHAVELAKHILSGVGRSLTVGDVAVTCFLQPTPGLMEDGIREILASGLGGGVSVTKGRRTAARLDFNPDLVVAVQTDTTGKPRATGDVKYRLRRADWPRNILEQAVTFAQVFTARKAFFLDFSDGSSWKTEKETIHDVEYHHFTWPCSAAMSPEDAEGHVISELQSALLG